LDRLVIGWSYVDDKGSSIFFPPEKLSELYKNRGGPTSGVSTCPAVQQFEKRSFFIKSPYTFKIRASKVDEDWTFQPVYPFTQVDNNILKSLLQFQPKSQWRDVNTPVLQLSLPYVFFSDTPAVINQVGIDYASNTNWSLIQGRFNIYDWQRPINWSIEWRDTNSDLVIKRGQPLFQVLFETKELDPKIQVEHMEMTTKLKRSIDKSWGVSKVTRGTSNIIKSSGEARKDLFLK
jgi:hypothetical protein